MTYNFQNKSNQEKITIILKELENGNATSPELVKETGLSQLVILHYLRHLIEIKKPGELYTTKAHQVLGQIVDK